MTSRAGSRRRGSTFSRRALAGAVALLLAAGSASAEEISDLTIEVGGELLEHGGVVTIYHLPVGEPVWAEIGESAPSIRLDARYAEVQLRYPEDGNFTYRFRPVEGTESAEKHATQVLSVIGTDMEGVGPGMEKGFKGDKSSGGRVIRVPAFDEFAGVDESTRTIARWGETQAFDDPPPADERSARGLVAIVDFGPRPLGFDCTGDKRVQACTIKAEEWTGLEARWWRAIAESRLERLRHYALRRCYDDPSAPSRCEPDPDSDEPDYIGRD